MRQFIWTVGAVALGIALATVQVGGKTPWQHTQRAWHEYVSPTQEKLQARVSDTFEDAKDKLVHSRTPHEHHSEADRTALSKLVPHRAPKASP
jgi:hypothetical protein